MAQRRNQKVTLNPTENSTTIIGQKNGIQVSDTGTTQQPLFDPNLMFSQALVNIQHLQDEIKEIKRNQEKTKEFYSSSSNLNKITSGAIIVLMLIPVIQLIICAGIVYSLGIEAKIASALNWFLGVVSFLSIIEVIVGGIKMFLYGKKISELEEKYNELKEER